MKNRLLHLIWMISKHTFNIFLGSLLGLSVLFANSGTAQVKSVREVSIELNLKNVKLEKVFEAIEKQTNFSFILSSEKVDASKRVSIVKQGTVAEILIEVSRQANLRFKQINRNISVKQLNGGNDDEVITIELSQDTEVTGQVTDENGPLPGVSIIVKNTTLGTITDVDGNYSLSVPVESETLVFSYVGYVSKEVPINGRSVVDVSLDPDIQTLSEIVVIGYGQQEAKDITGAIKTLSNEDFNGGVVNSPGQLLQGKIAGVNITSGTGEPGSAIDINIRGVNSISGGSNPLFVIDGVPIDAPQSAGGNVGGTSSTRPKSPLNFLNPQDIESITVLKDASATAIYGTRGANGVVIVETKKGSTGKGTLSYGTYVGVSSLARKIDVLDAGQYRTETARLATILGRDPATYIDEANANTDWQDEIFRTAVTQNHSLSFSGSNDNTRYNASLGYLDQEGLIEGTDHRRITGRINIGTSAINDRLKLQLNVAGADIRDESQATGGNAVATGNLLTSILRANPTSAPRDADGNLNAKAGAADNPVSYLELFRDRGLSKTVLASFNATFDITEELSYKVNLGYESTDTDRTLRVFPNSDEGGDIDQGRVVRTTREAANALIENSLLYKKSLESVDFDVLVAHSFQQFNNRGVFIDRLNFSTEEIDPVNNIGIATDTEGIGSSTSERKLQSYFGRVNASFLDKYLFTASVRADGSSVFGENNRYGVFPAVAVGWRISEEAFMGGNSGVFDNLKLRLGWGQTGNQAVPVKVTQGSFSSDSRDGFVFDGRDLINGLTVARTPNPDLKWEVTTQSNIGLDWSILNSRVYGTLDWFNKTTTDLFLEIAAPAPAIVSTIFVNADTEIINKGLEIELNANLIRNETFSLDIGGNVAFLDNTVEKLDNDILIGNISAPGATGETSSIYRSGFTAGSFFMPVFLGYDESGFEILSDESEIIGDALPDVIYGFNVLATYNNFDLSLNFNGVSGVDIFNNTARAYSNASSLGQNGNNVYSDFFDTRESPTRAAITSSRYVESGNFLRLNNATIGYNWDVSSVNWLSNLRLYITGQNLFVITDYSGYDPEVNTQGNNVYGVDFASYPRSRTFLFGMNVSF